MVSKKTAIGLLDLSLLAVILFAPIISIEGIESGYGEGIDTGKVRGQVTRAIFDDTGKLIDQYTIPNLITTAGLNHIKFMTGAGVASGAVDYIALANGTSPVIGSTTLDAEWASCGLSRSQATYYSNGDGNWTMAVTFTATADGCQVNTTGIFNATSGGTMFAGDTYSSTDTLNTNYQLQQNWTFWVE